MTQTLLGCLALLALWPAWGATQEIVVFGSDRDGDREIYAMDPDGEDQTNLSRHPGRDQAPALAPDGQRIAWLSDRSGRLGVWLMARDGSGQKLLRELPQADFGLAWSPGGDRLAVTLQGEEGGTHDLALLDVASGRLGRLTETPNEEEVTPSWSPQGDALYYIAGIGDSTALMRLGLESGNREIIASDLPSVAFPVPSPNGAEVVLRSRTDQFDVLLVDIDTGEIENITRHPANDWGAVWSRDGQSISFASDRDGDMEIYVLDLASGTLRKLTNNDDRDWMPTR